MLHPSYADLMKVVNKDVEEGNEPVVSSRYSIVMATSKRARQIISGDDVLVSNYDGRKPLSAAIEELNQGKIRILGDDEIDDFSDLDELEDLEEDTEEQDSLADFASDKNPDALTDSASDENPDAAAETVVEAVDNKEE
ncbi:MAG: DNA-directed RNA polymerase subunit omega [Clostridiales bacterium]|nr:DNA-directed RNA polymerase subunit omega [Clostridiales bacterium]